jgi:two-component system alkaline phosphatase synthesis response regulator PhoP
MAKILIVDDDPDIVLCARLGLERAGYTTIEARNSKEALEKVKIERPDLIILDAMMDSTTDGFQVALKLHSPDPASEYADFGNVPILMVTAIHSTTPIRFGPDVDYLPVNAFVEKPVQPDVLVEKVKSLLLGEKAKPQP